MFSKSNRRREAGPRESAAVPAMRRHKTKNLAYVNVAGRVVYLGRWGSPDARREYDSLIAEFLANGRKLPTCARDVSIAELAERYLDFARGYYPSDQKSGEFDMVTRAMTTLVKFYGRLAAAEFSPLKLKAIRQRWIVEGRVRTQVNAAVRRVIRCFKWGVENELGPGEVVHALKCVAGLRAGRSEAKESAPVQPVDDAHVDAVLPLLAAPVRAMVELQRLTGMRPGEVIQMTPATLDRSGVVWIYRPPRHKTQYRGRDRVVFVGPKGQSILGPFLEGRAADRPLFSPAESMAAFRARWAADRKTPLSCGNRKGTNRKAKPKKLPGDRYDVNSYRRAIEYACKRAGVPNWGPHRLRHTFATRVRKAHGLEAAQVLLGHARADVTQVYAERDEAKAAEVAAVVG